VCVSAHVEVNNHLLIDSVVRVCSWMWHLQVNISVTVSGSASSSGKILLNYISTPSVYVWSAVATSCALPGIMEPIKLMAKGPDGKPMPFMSDGINMIDGSLMADLPVRTFLALPLLSHPVHVLHVTTCGLHLLQLVFSNK
jgi:hypothetical protein